MIRIKINLLPDDVRDIEERKDIIVSYLQTLIDQLNESSGDMQQGKLKDEFGILEYVHLTNEPLETLCID